MNRRTADVVSRGFSNLFVLQKDDLETVLKDYEDAKRILNARARKLMRENEERLAKEVDEQKQLQEERKLRSKVITDVILIVAKQLQLYFFILQFFFRKKISFFLSHPR